MPSSSAGCSALAVTPWSSASFSLSASASATQRSSSAGRRTWRRL
jgi:hypothetical protein